MTDLGNENLPNKELDSSTTVRVLAAEDDPSLRVLYGRLFGQLTGVSRPFVQYVIVEDAQAALARFQAPVSRFNVVMTDYHMPGLNGAALAKQIKELDQEV